MTCIRMFFASSVLAATGCTAAESRSTPMPTAMGGALDMGEVTGTGGTSGNPAAGGAEQTGGQPTGPSGGSASGGEAGSGPEKNNKVKVFILSGQSNMQGQGTMTPNADQLARNGGMGTLQYLVEDPAQADVYGHLITDDGSWAERDDVWIVDLERSGPLSAGYGVNEEHIGPELQFGNVVGDYYESPVLIIKASWGGKSLYVDFRPPSSGGELGPYYTMLIERVHAVLDNIDQEMPNYNGEGYEIAGFGWHQGWNDRVNQDANDEYQVNCVNFINDLRDEFGVAEMPFVLAITGMTGWEDMHPRALSLMAAQLAVPEDPGLNAGNVFAVETRDYWRDAAVSPADQGYHWNRSAETMFLVGDGMGQAMVGLLAAP